MRHLRPELALRVLGRGSGLVAVLGAIGFLGAGSAEALPACHRASPDRDPLFNRRVLIYKHRGLSCGQAVKVANAVADRYEVGLPLRDYPPPPSGVPGGGGRWFHVSTPLGGFACRLTERGSDFDAGVCKQRRRLAVFESDNQWYVRQ
jgi:hypothetical protein